MNPSYDKSLVEEREKSNAERLRVQFDFSPQAFKRLENIRKLAEARSNAEVVRDALRVYEWFIEQKRANNKLQVVTGDTIKEVELLL